MVLRSASLYECVVHDEGRNDTVFEENLIVFQSSSEKEMPVRLRSLGEENEVSYENTYGDLVEWKFREILEVQEIIDDSVGDGTEVFFRDWHNPESRDFELMRRTHEEPWWEESPKAPAPTAPRRTRAKKTSPARAS